jgi:glycosyltransferase involved in cell wall biosynthesis
MHLTFLLSASLDSPYGKGRCLPLVTALAAQGYRITILALHHDWERCTQKRVSVTTDGDPIEIIYVGQMAVRKRDGKKQYFPAWQLMWVLWAGFIGFLRAGRAIRTDAYHVGKAQPVNGLAGWLLSRLTRRPLFVDCDDYEAVANHFTNPLQRRLVAWVEDWLPRQANGVTVNTTFLAERYHHMGYPARRIVQVPNGVPALPSLDAPLPSSLATVYATIPPHAPLIVYVGTLALESHPVDLLLEAFALLATQNTDAHLLVVGGGPDENHIRALAGASPAASRIHFTGQLPPDDALFAYRLATITVDPVHDNDVARARCPLKLMESLKAGKPIVTGDVGDRRTWLGADFAGWLVSPGSAEALAQGMASVLSERERRTSSAIQARADHFAPDKLALQWAQIYAPLEKVTA